VEGSTLKKSAAKFSSSLIKNRCAENFAGLNAAKSAGLTADEMRKGWSAKPISITASTLVSHAAKSVYDAICFYAWRSGKDLCEEPEEVLAGSSNTSLRTARQSLIELAAHGFIVRERISKGRFAGAIRPVPMCDIPQAGARPKADDIQCLRCNKYHRPNALKLCPVCRRDVLAEKQVAEQIALGFDSQTVVWANLKAHGSKCGQKEIARAFLKLANPVPKIAGQSAQDNRVDPAIKATA